jgi:hypothetical protein
MIDKLALRAQLRAERDAFASEASEAILAPEAFVERLTAGMTIAPPSSPPRRPGGAAGSPCPSSSIAPPLCASSPGE